MLAKDSAMGAAVYGFMSGDKLDARQELSASHFLTGMFRTMGNQFFAYHEGTFSESSWFGYRTNILVNIWQPRFIRFWNRRRELFSAEFAEYIDGLLRQNEHELKPAA
jgi:hypothetical protein